MTDEQFTRICFRLLDKLKSLSPIDTGNLRYNAIRIEFKNNDCHIYVDEDIAPYMKFTNEPWIPENHYGHTNPNEHWFDNAIQEIISEIAGLLGEDFISVEVGK